MASVNLSLLLSLLSSYVSMAYRVRQNTGLAGYDDPYSLSNAFGAINLQRRQLKEQSRPRFPYNGKGGYFYPRDTIPNMAVLDESLNFPYESYPYSIADQSRSWNSPQKRTAYRPHRVAPSINELRQLFGSANLPVKRVAPVRRRYYQTDMEDKTDSENTGLKDDEKGSSNERDRLTDKLRKLIDAAEKLENEETVTETKTVTTEDGPVEEVKETDITETEPLKDESGAFKEKVVEVFEDALEKNSDENEDGTAFDDEESQTVSDSGTLEPEDNNKFSESQSSELEELISEYLSKSQTKTKRASSTEMSNVEPLLRKIAELKSELSNIQILKALEDKENDYLAHALKYATLDQLVGGDEFMTKEYEDIVKATETEELLQMLGPEADQEEENPASADTVEDSEAEDYGPGLVKKRTDTDSEGWYDTPITEKVVGGAELHDADQDKRGAETNIMGSEFPIDIRYPDDSDEDNDEEEEMADDVDDDTNELETDTDEDNLILRQLLSGMSPEQIRELVEDYTETAEEVQGFCPAVMELSSNCAFVDQQGILIDDEARNLCNRHEMCYTCGSDIGLSQERCDVGYKNTVLEECEGDIRCLRSAITFLKLMQEYHSYSLFGAPQCQQSCVERFIYQGD